MTFFINFSHYCIARAFLPFIADDFDEFLIHTGADIRLHALHALQQRVCIHLTQDVPNINAFGSFVWRFMDLRCRLLLWHSIQHFHTQRDKREEFK